MIHKRVETCQSSSVLSVKTIYCNIVRFWNILKFFTTRTHIICTPRMENKQTDYIVNDVVKKLEKK